MLAAQQIVPAGKIFVEIGNARLAFLQCVGLHRVGSLAVQLRHEERLVQLGSDEAQPLLQAGALHSGRRRETGVGETARDMLQDRRILGQHLALIVRSAGTRPSGLIAR